MEKRFTVVLEKDNILRLVYADVDPEKEGDFNQWYDTEHERLLSQVEGVIKNYKAVNLSQEGQKYFYLYLHENPDVQNSPQYKAVSQTTWSKEIRPFVRNFKAESYKVLLGGAIPTELKKGNIVRTIHFDLKDVSDAAFNDWFKNEYAPMAKKNHALISLWEGINLNETGPKYLLVYFLNTGDIPGKTDLNMVLPKEGASPMLSHFSNIVGKNYELKI